MPINVSINEQSTSKVNVTFTDSTDSTLSFTRDINIADLSTEEEILDRIYSHQRTFLRRIKGEVIQPVVEESP